MYNGPTLGPATYWFQLVIDPTTNDRMLTLGQCWANVVLPTPTIGQLYYPMPTLAQHSHAIWDMRIPGTETSSVILSQTKYKKLKSDAQNVPIEDKTERDGVINPKLLFQSILTPKILMLSKRCESTEVDRRDWLHVPSGTLWSTSSDTHTHHERDFY